MANISNSINNPIYTFVSPLIDAKVTGLTTFFTTLQGSRFIPLTLTSICESGVGIVGDSTFNIGFTAANYDDWLSGSSFSNTIVGDFVVLIPPGIAPLAPVSTPIIIKLTGADSGTSATYHLVMTGVYID